MAENTELDALLKEQEEIKAKQAEASNETDAAKRKEVVDALTKEEARLRESIDAARKERLKKDATFQEKFQQEQFEKAKQKFFSDFKYSEPEAQTKLLGVLEKVKSGSIDAENVYKDFETAHLLLNKEKYINLEKEVSSSERAAAEYAANSSSGAFAGAGDGVKVEQVDLSADDIRAAQWAGMPLEKYRDLKAKGKI